MPVVHEPEPGHGHARGHRHSHSITHSITHSQGQGQGRPHHHHHHHPSWSSTCSRRQSDELQMRWRSSDNTPGPQTDLPQNFFDEAFSLGGMPAGDNDQHFALSLTEWCNEQQQQQQPPQFTTPSWSNHGLALNLDLSLNISGSVPVAGAPGTPMSVPQTQTFANFSWPIDPLTPTIFDQPYPTAVPDLQGNVDPSIYDGVNFDQHIFADPQSTTPSLSRSQSYTGHSQTYTDAHSQCSPPAYPQALQLSSEPRRSSQLQHVAYPPQERLPAFVPEPPTASLQQQLKEATEVLQQRSEIAAEAEVGLPEAGPSQPPKRRRRSTKKPKTAQETAEARTKFLARNKDAAKRCRERKKEGVEQQKQDAKNMQEIIATRTRERHDLMIEVETLRAQVEAVRAGGGCDEFCKNPGALNVPDRGLEGPCDALKDLGDMMEKEEAARSATSPADLPLASRGTSSDVEDVFMDADEHGQNHEQPIAKEDVDVGKRKDSGIGTEDENSDVK